MYHCFWGGHNTRSLAGGNHFPQGQQRPFGWPCCVRTRQPLGDRVKGSSDLLCDDRHQTDINLLEQYQPNMYVFYNEPADTQVPVEVVGQLPDSHQKETTTAGEATAAAAVTRR
ncbi:uncharacterized protein ACO6RY_09832 [Pungitius sinensis]